jgi:hypothetical protein
VPPVELGSEEVPGCFVSGGLVDNPFRLTPSFVKSTTDGRPALSPGERET